MSNLDYELYYMSGLPIDLTHKKLGIVYQPKLKDFIRNKIDISHFTHPFIFDKDMISNKKDSVDNLLKDLGRLEFLIVYNDFTILNKSTSEKGIIELLIDSLKLLYRTENVQFFKTIGKLVIDNKIIIGNDELDFLSDLILEMMKIDKEEIKKNLVKEDDENLDIFERRAREYARKVAEKKGKNKKDFGFMDIVNVIIHSQSTVDYDRVFNMTMYQLKNSYEVLVRKEMFNIKLLHRISPNFKPDEKFELWEEQINIAKSNLNSMS